MKRIHVLTGLFVVLAGVAYFTLTPKQGQRQPENGMQAIYEQVVTEAVAQYQIAKRQGDPMQICTQAGLVTAGYLQAQNESQYRAWKAIEKADCEKAGLR
jgi:hypothetical protein